MHASNTHSASAALRATNPSASVASAVSQEAVFSCPDGVPSGHWMVTQEAPGKGLGSPHSSEKAAQHLGCC